MVRTLSNSGASKGFTLVELLVVIAIISVLMGLVFPALMKGKGKADQAACGSNLRQIQISSALYEQDYRIYPYLDENAAAFEHLQLLVDTGYGDKPKLFICPAAKRDREAEVDDEDLFVLEERTCSYAWTNVPRSLSSKGTKILAGDKQYGELQHADGINIVYVGGDVKWLRAKEEQPWEEMTKGQLAK